MKPAVKKPLTLVSATLVIAGLYGMYKYKEESADGRILIYKVSTDIIKKHPLTGVGFDHFKAYYMDAQAARLRVEKGSLESFLADNTYYAFNEPLQLTVENGLAGLLLICTMAAVCFCLKVSENAIPLKQLSLSILLAGFGFGLFAYPSYILPIKTVMVLVLALLAHIEKGSVYKKEWNFPSVRKLLLAKVIAIVACTAITGWIIQTSQRLTTGFMDWQLAQEQYDGELYKECVLGFETVYPILQYNGDFLMQFGKALAMTEQYSKAIAILERAKTQLNTTVIETTLGDSYKAPGNYNAAEQAYQQAADMAPGRFYPPYLLAKLYELSGQKQKAYQKAREIMAKEVKIPSTAINEIKAEMQELINSYEGKPPPT